MDANQLKFILEELEFSADLPHQVLEQLAAASTTRQLPAKEYLFREGSENRNLYFIHSGKLALEMKVPGTGTVRILTLGPGEMVGWSSMLDQGKMTASVVAVTDAKVVVAPAAKLSELCETSHDFGYHLMRQMAGALSKRLVATRLQLLDLFGDTPAASLSSSMEGT